MCAGKSLWFSIVSIFSALSNVDGVGKPSLISWSFDVVGYLGPEIEASVNE